ncbi:MAG TPA: hypothetical protein VGA75_06155, partial [Paracoccaceae bacterium]
MRMSFSGPPMDSAEAAGSPCPVKGRALVTPRDISAKAKEQGGHPALSPFGGFSRHVEFQRLDLLEHAGRLQRLDDFR